MSAADHAELALVFGFMFTETYVEYGITDRFDGGGRQCAVARGVAPSGVIDTHRPLEYTVLSVTARRRCCVRMYVRPLKIVVLSGYRGFFWELKGTSALTLSPGFGSMNIHAVGQRAVSVADGPCRREGSSATDHGCVEAKSDNLSVMLDTQLPNRLGPISQDLRPSRSGRVDWRSATAHIAFDDD